MGAIAMIGPLTKLDRVLAIVEPGAEHQAVIDRLEYLAKRSEFEVILAAADYSQYLVEGYYFSEVELPELRKQYLAEREVLLEGLAEPLRQGGLQVTTRALWSHPAYEGVLQLAEEYQPDLIVHHVQRHAALSRMILTTNDWQLARHSNVPLLMVKEKTWSEAPVILAAVDPMHARHKPSGLDHKILGTAEFLASELSGTAAAAHAYGQFPLSGLYPSDAQEQHRRAFDTLMADFHIPESRQHLLEEAPEFGLRTLEADLGADLVVLGSVSRSIIKDVFIGNTTEKVLDFLESDVLLIRHDA